MRRHTTTYTTPEYHFYLRDHLGNNRVDVAADGRVCQVTDYYPYGLPMASSRNAAFQRWLFGGKELDRISGLDLYDFEARAYDPALARFTSHDAFEEKYYPLSPYLYCAANPLRLIDPDGNKIVFDSSCSEEFINAFNEAWNTLKKADASQNIDYLDQVDIDINIVETSYNPSETSIDDNKKISFDADTNTLSWDPHCAVSNPEYFLSPTENLQHEADHAVRAISDYEGMMADRKKKDTAYSNPEERRVITGSETETARKLGKLPDYREVTRSKHTGQFNRVPHVNSGFIDTEFKVNCTATAPPKKINLIQPKINLPTYISR